MHCVRSYGFTGSEVSVSTSTPASDSGRDRLLRQFKNNLANAGGSPTAGASGEQALAAQGFALRASRTAGVQKLERVGAQGTVQPTPPDSNYLITFGNLTSGTVFSQVIVVFACTGSPEPEAIGAPDVGPSRGIEFTVCPCSALQAYIVGVSVGGNQAVQIIPAPPDVMTPQLASQVNPDDPGPCSDIWTIVDA
jgi:hypothetical protein